MPKKLHAFDLGPSRRILESKRKKKGSPRKRSLDHERHLELRRPLPRRCTRLRAAAAVVQQELLSIATVVELGVRVRCGDTVVYEYMHGARFTDHHIS
jgi:hypothetical protein